MNNFINKYRPTTRDEIIGNKQTINHIYEWICNFKNKKDVPSNIIITGIHGIGKTLATHILLKECDYQVAKIDLSSILLSIKSGKYSDSNVAEQWIADLDNTLFKEKKNVAYVIDDIKMISSQKEKALLLSIRKYNEKYKKFPLIFISDGQHNKLINELKKTSVEYKFNYPTKNDLTKLIQKICLKENIKLDLTKDDDEENIIDDICEHSQFDVRRLVNILQSLHDIYENVTITRDEMQAFIVASKKKDIDINLYAATDDLFESYHGIDGSLILFESDKPLVPLTIHQNYYKYIKTKFVKYGVVDKLKLLSSIADNLSVGDVVEGYTYSNQSWDLQEISGYYTTVLSSYKINNSGKKNSSKMDALEPCYKYVFPKDLNRTSIKNINKKNINNIVDYFPGKTVRDYIYLNKIINNFIAKKQYKKIIDLLLPYGVGVEQIDSLLKIDKIRKSKSTLDKDVKKNIIKYLKEN